MALNTKKLKDIFGADDDDVMTASPQAQNIFTDDDDTVNDTTFTDIDIEQAEDDRFPPAPILRNPSANPITSKDCISDIDYALRVQSDLLNRQQQLIQMALSNVADGGNAKDIEAASKSIEAASAMAEKLLSLHEKIAKMKAVESGNDAAQGNIITGNTINQVIYQGTTDDIIEKIKNGVIDAN